MSENLSGEFRPKKAKFAQISNAALQDAKLSLKAKGLYSVIQSLITIPGINLKVYRLKKMCKEKDRAFDSAWKELKDAGYLKMYRMPGGKNGAFKYEYELLDTPDTVQPALINRNKYGEDILTQKDNEEADHTLHFVGNGESNGPLASDPNDKPDDCSDQQTDSSVDHTPHFVGYGQEQGSLNNHTLHFAPNAECIPCSMHPMRNVGYINNTPSSNTLSNNTLSSNTSVSQSYEDGLTDFLREKIKIQIEYDYFEENKPDDLSTVDAIIDYLVEMQTVRATKINGVTQTREALEPYIARVDSTTIMEFMEHMRGKSFKNVKNVSAYWRSCLINFLRDREAQKMTV